VILPARQTRTVQARTGLLCLDLGPSALPADPGEPLLELDWDGGPAVVIRRTGRHPVWLVNRSTNHVAHPLNVTLRQDVLLEPLDAWLASKFKPHHLGGTIDELAAASVVHEIDPGDAEADAKIADCDRKLAQYRATLDAGADPATVARWITETEAERARHKAAKRAATPWPAATSMSRDEIASVVAALSDLLAVLRDADPADKAEIYTQLGLRLTYQPRERTVRTEVHIAPAQHWQFESVRGGT